MLVVGIVLGVVALFIGVPIFAVFILGAGLPLFYGLGVPLSAVSNLCIGAINKYVLLAIPLFILAGNLMVGAGAARRMIELFSSLIGHLPGGMAMVAIAACAFFGACSGSSLAVIVAVGSIMIPTMERYGYSRRFSAALISVAAILGLIIPPSNAYIIYGAITGTSVGDLFIAGIIPGLLITIVLCVFAFFVCRGRFAIMPRASWGQRGRSFMAATPSLLVPLVVLGGIYAGVVTPTEAAAVACGVAIIVGLIYRELTWKSFTESMKSAARGTGIVFMLISTAVFLSAMFSYFKVPQTVTLWAANVIVSPTAFLLMTGLVILLLGTFIEAVPLAYISLPILFPVTVSLGIDPLVFGVFGTIMIGAGQITPPVGVGLYTASAISGTPAREILREVIPSWIIWVATGFIFIFIPALATFLPNLR